MTSDPVKWLRDLGHRSVIGISVTIGEITYHGASYIGATDPDARTWLYLVGPLPPSYRRSTKTCYRFQGDERDWYIGSYIEAHQIVETNRAYHPFGVAFQLMPWQHSCAIDAHEPKPYTRIDASIEAKP